MPSQGIDRVRTAVSRQLASPGEWTHTAVRMKRRVQRQIDRVWLGRGDAVECTFCGWTGSKFMPSPGVGTANRMCPNCRSLDRYRALHLYMQQQVAELEAAGKRIRLLEVAPSRHMLAWATSTPSIEYHSVDLLRPPAEVRGDLCSLPYPDQTFDLIICFHVLEHVPDDHSAMSELRRVLSAGGLGVFQVPLREGTPTEEDPAAGPDERTRRFGQSDHVRMYGPDVTDRLKAAGFEVDLTSVADLLGREAMDRHGCWGDDKYLVLCRRAPATVGS